MAELPTMIRDLALMLMVAGVVTLVFKKLKQPLVLGYIVAGFLVSPHMPYTTSVVDMSNIHLWADIGVMFLLFSLGLDFSFKKILKMGASPIISVVCIIFAMSILGVIVGHSFGWSKMNCIFLGGMLAMSSTTIIYKAFDDLGLRQQQFAGLVMSVLILEDILAIVMMVMLSAIASGSNPNGGQMLGALIKIGFFLILWLIVGIFAIPLFLRRVRKLINSEVLLIVSLGLCCAMAVISTEVGFSSAFGAFIMGSILAETIEAERIEKLVEPVKNLFGAVFFVSVGMLVDPKIIVDYAMPIFTLVKEQSFSGKRVVPFCTFGSGGLNTSSDQLKKALPEAKIEKGYGVRTARLAAAARELDRFLKENGYKLGTVTPLPDYSSQQPVTDDERAIFDAACSSYQFPLGTPQTAGKRETSESTDYKFTVKGRGMNGEESTSIIYVTVGKSADAKPEFTEVVR